MSSRGELIAETDRILAGVVGTFPATVGGPLAALATGGSRHRSSLLFDLLAPGGRDGAAAAAAIELLHLATLIHDDVVDGSELRRHVPSLHVASDVPTAIWVADALYAEALHLALAVTPVAGRNLAAALRRVAGSQVLEATHPGTDAYWEVVDGKTGALFDLAFELADELMEGALPAALGRSVTAFGRLFQYVDDLGDLVGDGASLGKPTGLDARNDLHTLPMADLAVSGARVQERLRSLRDAVLDPLDAEDGWRALLEHRVDALVARVGGLP